MSRHAQRLLMSVVVLLLAAPSVGEAQFRRLTDRLTDAAQDQVEEEFEEMVRGAYHEGTIRIDHRLTPIGVAMAGANEHDPYPLTRVSQQPCP